MSTTIEDHFSRMAGEMSRRRMEAGKPSYEAGGRVAVPPLMTPAEAGRVRVIRNLTAIEHPDGLFLLELVDRAVEQLPSRARDVYDAGRADAMAEAVPARTLMRVLWGLAALVVVLVGVVGLVVGL